ncbi:MAG: DNA mismatch repair endonuclease MutL, partial [Synergistaceae bacterium]|nr:DNA mismatch repair endonuclease MutL [Synergistaceae bacterium]
MPVEIRLLPEQVWSRIAAGEVVERPASAVKEMIENSLDAGARRIRVKLWDGGRVRIVVEDDGSGIAFEELPLALTSHATSKIGGIEDLEAIRTLGYRGEALASLTAVAKVEIRSRPSLPRPLDKTSGPEAEEDSKEESEEEFGGVIRAYEGRVSDHVRVKCTPGTRVQVDELFTNLPARRKFLKSAAGELRRVVTILREYAICRPEVGFSLEHDGRPVFSTDGGGVRRRAIEQLWGAEPAILTAGASVAHVELECWWQPRQGRNDIASFVNGRSVTDPLIKGALNAAARELVGGWALFFSIDPSLIDVNIHPAKAEIRFSRPSEVFEVVKEAVSQLGAPAPVYVKNGQTFSTDSPKRLQDASPPEAESWNFKTGFGSAAFDDSKRGVFKSANASFSRPQTLSVPGPDSFFSRVEPPDFGPVPPAVTTEELPCEETPRVLSEVSGGVPPVFFEASDTPVVYLGQLGSGYLLFDVSEGLAVVDPHAAHERVAFERLRAAAQEGQRSQALSMPAPLPPTLQLEVEEKREILESAGFVLESRDGGLWLAAVPSFASCVTPPSPEALLRGALAALQAGGDADPVELLWRAWATMACKEAVKVTTKLLPEEALALWHDLQGCQQPFFCP